MRARNLKPGFFENEDLSLLPFEGRILFAGLWCYADREGRFEWRPKRIKALIFPYDNVKIERLLEELLGKGFIRKYEIDGSEYGDIPTFLKHQNPHPHEARSKIPGYPEKEQVNQCHDMSVTLHGMSEECNADSLNPDSLNPDSLNPDSLNPDSNTSCAEPSRDSTPEAPPVIEIPTNLFQKSGEQFGVTQALVEEYQRLYPAVDIVQSLNAMRAWAISNPMKRKTSSGMLRFVNSWLAREQNGAGNGRHPPDGKAEKVGRAGRVAMNAFQQLAQMREEKSDAGTG